MLDADIRGRFTIGNDSREQWAYSQERLQEINKKERGREKRTTPGPKKERPAINRRARQSFNLYHRALSDSRNSRTKFISHRIAERGRLFTVIARCELKFNNEFDLIALLRLPDRLSFGYDGFLGDSIVLFDNDTRQVSFQKLGIYSLPVGAHGENFRRKFTCPTIS